MKTERKTGAWTEMWNATYRGRTIMLVVFQLVQTIGYYGFNSWVPALLISQGIDVTKIARPTLSSSPSRRQSAR